MSNQPTLPTATTTRLIDAAQAVLGDLQLPHENSAGAVAAAILTNTGNIYTGINIDLSSGLGFCAEISAIADMIKHRETHIIAVVAMCEEGVLPPCGRCRETMAQINFANFEAQVIVSLTKTTLLKDLLPNFWMDIRK